MGYAKQKEGEVILLYWDNKPEALYVKGHVDPSAADLAIRQEYEDYYRFEQPVPAYARWSMEYRHFDHENGLVLRDCDGPGPGRFKVMKVRVI